MLRQDHSVVLRGVQQEPMPGRMWMNRLEENWLVLAANRRYKTVRRAASLPPDGKWERHGRSSDKHNQSDYQKQAMRTVEKR